MRRTVLARLFALSLLVTSLLGAGAQGHRVLRLTFMGDIMAHDVNYRMKDFRDIYRGVEPIVSQSDLTVANLELPVDPTRPESGYPFFNGNLAYVRAAVDAGVNVFSLANNHAFDGGEEGVFQTLRSLRALGVASTRPLFFSGIRGNPQRPFIPETILVRGVRVGFIAATQFLNEQDAGGHVNMVDYCDEAAADAFLQYVKDASPLFDLFIVSYHGDQEYAREPSVLKRAFFHRLLESGAHIVFSHHPHIAQGYEVVRVGGAGRLIMYSMGNFISAMTWRLDPENPDETAAATGEAYLLSVEVRCAAGGCSVAGVVPFPIANYRNTRGEMVAARLSDLAGGAVKLPRAWQAFYAQRLDRMLRFLGRFDTGGGPGGDQ